MGTQQPRNSPTTTRACSTLGARPAATYLLPILRSDLNPFLLWVFVLAVCEPCSAQGGWGYSSPPPGRHGALVKKMTFYLRRVAVELAALTLDTRGVGGNGCVLASASTLVLFVALFGFCFIRS